jgi:CelD/BcsL family acetyltransferase involved in cellulose biosynthesis
LALFQNHGWPGLRRLYCAGEGPSDYQAVYVRDHHTAWAQALFSRVLQQPAWDVLELYPLIEAEGRWLGSLWQQHPAAAAVDWVPRGACYATPLPTGWEAHIAKAVRRDIAYQTKRLEQHGYLHVQRAATEPDVAALLLVFFNLHVAQWSAKRQRSQFQHAHHRSRYLRLAQAWLAEGVLDLQVLYLDKVPLAAHLGAQTAVRYYYFIPTYNPAYRRYSPGKVLLWRLIQQAAGARATAFDFLRGAEEYKAQWGATQQTPMGALRVYRHTWGSRLRRWLDCRKRPALQASNA